MRALATVVCALSVISLGVPGCSKGGTPPQAKAANEIITQEEFRARVLGSDIPALVDFYADWCPPCRELAPILDGLQREYAGRIAFFRVDTDRAGELSREHEIRFLPTLVLYRNGQPVGERIEGLLPAAALRQRLDALLAAS